MTKSSIIIINFVFATTIFFILLILSRVFLALERFASLAIFDDADLSIALSMYFLKLTSPCKPIRPLDLDTRLSRSCWDTLLPAFLSTVGMTSRPQYNIHTPPCAHPLPRSPSPYRQIYLNRLDLSIR